MAEQVKEPAVKTIDLSSIPENYMAEGEKHVLKIVC